MLVLATLYFVFFLILGFRNFSWSVYLLLATIPSYVIRFDIGPLPTSLLEIAFFAVCIAGVCQVTKEQVREMRQVMKTEKIFVLSVLGLLVFSLGGAAVSMIGALDPVQKLIYGIGEWRAFFLEPIIVFILLFIHREKIERKKIIGALFVAAVFVSVVALVQKFTGLFFAPSLWDDYLFGRVTSIFTTPNAIGLFTVPILCVSLMLYTEKKILVSLGMFFILAANYFSQSQGAWIALGASALVYVFIRGYRKIAVGIALVGVVGALALPSLREAILFQDRAGENRIVLWQQTMEYLTESPKNALLGTGIRNFFDAIQQPIYNPVVMEALKYPHTIVLNFWTEIGLFGLLSFALIFGYLVRGGMKISDTKIKAAYIAALVAILVHGLVDVPYFKNDLALLFWVLAWCIYREYYDTRSTKT
jgi:hypothetical protein